MTADGRFRSVAKSAKSFLLSYIHITSRHNDEEYFPAIPATHLAYAPAIDALAQRHRLAEANELRFDETTRGLRLRWMDACLAGDV